MNYALLGLALPALSVTLGLAPIRSPFPLAVAGWVIGLVAVELPLHLALIVVAIAGPPLFAGELTAGDLVSAGVAVLICAGLGVLLARQYAAGRVLDDALTQAGIGPTRGSTGRRRTPWLTVLLQPWPLRPRGVSKVSGMAYGPDPCANRFDLYRDDAAVAVRGVLIHLHGGHFRAGGPSRESRALLFDHAARGWICLSATYHLSATPEEGFPQHLVDVKRLIHWIRTQGPEHGIPAGSPIVMAGSSAGAHITMMTAVTAGDPRFQPGFEDADTSITAAVGLYGYYGRLGEATADVSDPVRHPSSTAPAVFVVHGTLDTYTPLKGSRRLVRHLRASSPNPVAYAELPGAQHGFDPFNTVRFLRVVRAVAAFTDSLD